MKTLILAGLVAAISLAPALTLAQTNINGPSGRDTKGNPGVTQPTDQMPKQGTHPAPAPSTAPPDDRQKTSDTPSTITNKNACERAGGKWHDVDRKCGI